MTCAQCGRTADWNPTGYCSWSSYDRPRESDYADAPWVFAYFAGLGRTWSSERLLPDGQLVRTTWHEPAVRLSARPSPTRHCAEVVRRRFTFGPVEPRLRHT